jgi:hypothetical protein
MTSAGGIMTKMVVMMMIIIITGRENRSARRKHCLSTTLTHNKYHIDCVEIELRPPQGEIGDHAPEE